MKITKKINLVNIAFVCIILLAITRIITDYRIRGLEKTVKELHCNCVMPNTVPAQAPEDKPMQPLQQMKRLKLGE